MVILLICCDCIITVQSQHMRLLLLCQISLGKRGSIFVGFFVLGCHALLKL